MHGAMTPDRPFEVRRNVSSSVVAFTVKVVLVVASYRLVIAEGGLEALADHPSAPTRVWNRIGEDIRQQILAMALEQTDLSPRELTMQAEMLQLAFAADGRIFLF